MLRMISGLLARAVRPLKAAAEAGASPPPSRPWNPVVTETVDAGPTDTEMVEWLETQHRVHCADHPDRVVLRMSSTNRGWRLHNDSNRSWATRAEPSETVRGAIDWHMKAAAWCALDPDRVPTDAERLDWLDLLTGSYTNLVIWRRSTRGPGWRLHETSWDGAKPTVREALIDAMGSEC